MSVELDSQTQQRLGLSRSEIVEFCQYWHITELALFGSVLRDEFRTDSDVDILISFAPSARQGLLTLAKIKHDLEDRLGRSVDVVPKQSVEMSSNPFRRDAILQTARVIYEQR
jgi:hypothetical protein